MHAARALALSALLVLAGCAEVAATAIYGGDPTKTAAYSLGLGPKDFSIWGMQFSEDGRTLAVSYTYQPRTKTGTDWTVLDLTSLAMKDAAPEICARRPAAPDYLDQVRTAPDGAFELGRGTKGSPAGSGLFMRAAAGGPVTKISSSNDRYFFRTGGDVIYLTRHVYPANAATEAVPDGTFVRAYDLRRATYVDPLTFEPVPAPTSRQIILQRQEYASLVDFTPVGLDSTERRILFVGRAASDTLPVLAKLKAELAGRGEKIALRDQLMFQFDLDRKELSLHPFIEHVVSDAGLLGRTKSPRVALLHRAPGGDYYFTVHGLHALFRYRDGVIAHIMEFPRPSRPSDQPEGLAVSPDGHWAALRRRAPETPGSGWNTYVTVLDASGKAVFQITRDTVKPIECPAAAS